MRKLIVTAATIAGISLPTAAGAQAVIAADTAGPDVVVTAPPAAVIVPQPYTSERVYIAPEAYAYYDAGPRYYQDCWWDWGRRVCRLKPWW